jgi:hypothetical protein
VQSLYGGRSRLVAPLFVAILAATLGGCGMSSLTSGLGSGIFGGSSNTTAATTPSGEVNEAQLLEAAKADPNATGSVTSEEIIAGCPKVLATSRDNNLTIYEQGRAGDGLAIVHRGEITKTARECQIEPGRVTMKVGFSGRVLLGPRGKSGPISLPVNVVVTDAKREKVFAEKLKIDTNVAVENPIGYFSTVRTVTFAVPEGARPGEFEVNVSFDRNVPGAG